MITIDVVKIIRQSGDLSLVEIVETLCSDWLRSPNLPPGLRGLWGGICGENGPANTFEDDTAPELQRKGTKCNGSPPKERHQYTYMLCV